MTEGSYRNAYYAYVIAGCNITVSLTRLEDKYKMPHNIPFIILSIYSIYRASNGTHLIVH